jgi:hypothetical protein
VIHTEETVTSMLRELGCEVSQPMARWLSEFLLPDEVLLDARIWKDDLLAFSGVRILRLVLRDRGNTVWAYASVMLNAISEVGYFCYSNAWVVYTGEHKALTVEVVKELGSLAPFIRTLISIVYKAQHPA